MTNGAVGMADLVMRRIEDDVERQGVLVSFCSKLPNNWLGAYYRQDHLILLRPGMGDVTRRSVLAHELGHAYYRHERLRDGTCESWRQEALADAYAAKLLIDPANYFDIVKSGIAHAAAAAMLHVLPWVVDNYEAVGRYA